MRVNLCCNCESVSIQRTNSGYSRQISKPYPHARQIPGRHARDSRTGRFSRQEDRRVALSLFGAVRIQRLRFPLRRVGAK